MAETVSAFIAYDGPALRSGEMDVRDLAPALMALGDMVQHANRRLNGNKADATIRVRSDFKKGSFGVALRVVQTIADTGLFDAATIVDAIALAKMLGLVVYSEGPKEWITNVFDLAKFLGGEPPKDTQPQLSGDQAIEITNSKGDTTIVNHGTLILYEDSSVRADMRRVLRPLAEQGIDTFETRDPDGVEVVERIDKAEAKQLVPSLPERVTAKIASAASSPELVTTSVGLFQIASLDWKDGNKWRLNAGVGEFWAEITDQSFLSKVHRREILFGEGDVLKAEYTSSVERPGRRIVATTTITRVLDVIPPDDSNHGQRQLADA